MHMGYNACIKTKVTGINLNTAVHAIQSCGLTFQIWTFTFPSIKKVYRSGRLTANEVKKATTGHHEGNDKKTLLQRLPFKFPVLLPRNDNEVMNLWEVWIT